MVSRVAEAISKFIKPISSTKNARNESEGEREKRQGRKSPKSPPATIEAESTEPTDLEKEKTPSNPEQTPDPPVNVDGSVSSSFLEIIGTVQSKNAKIFQWLAVNTYQRSSQGQKKIGKRKKGVMLDEKAE